MDSEDQKSNQFTRNFVYETTESDYSNSIEISLEPNNNKNLNLPKSLKIRHHHDKPGHDSICAFQHSYITGMKRYY